MRENQPLIILIGLLAITLILLLVFESNGEVFGVDADDFARVGYLLPIALLVGAGALHRNVRLPHMLRNILIWVVLLVILMVGYELFGPKDEQDAVEPAGTIASLFMQPLPLV